MIKEFVDAWDKNKTKLEEYIKTHKQNEYNTYERLVEMLLNLVVNPYFDEELNQDVWWSNHITTIDDGDYQGTQIFMIPKNTYQPNVDEYVWTYQSYGSCSGCDTLLAISEYDDNLPSEEQAKNYMTLELHLLQRCKYMVPEKDDSDEN